MTPVRVFARVDTGRVPDESTICQFRHWLEQPKLMQTLFVPSPGSSQGAPPDRQDQQDGGRHDYFVEDGAEIIVAS